jgi:hypothetical protein
MTQTEWTMKLIELGYFDFCGLGTDKLAALEALDAAARIDHESAAPSPDRERMET